MKKAMQLSMAVFCAVVMFSSCASGVDADVTKAKGYFCKIMDLGPKMQAGDADATAEFEKNGKEMEAFFTELETKYPEGSEDKKKLEEEMKKISENPEAACK
ncbi:hypothetical protein BH09BAC1_BH09BAC1_12950 [soil metagenome]